MSPVIFFSPTKQIIFTQAEAIDSVLSVFKEKNSSKQTLETWDKFIKYEDFYQLGYALVIFFS